MSDERWTKVTREQRDARPVLPSLLVNAYDAAEGQRVESIRWCETHKVPYGACEERRFWRNGCVISEATLILPPRAES